MTERRDKSLRSEATGHKNGGKQLIDKGFNLIIRQASLLRKWRIFAVQKEEFTSQSLKG